MVRLNGEAVRVHSVRDLFEHVLRFIAKSGRRDALRALLPYKTSSRRYLIAEKPQHPSGKPFFVPVQHGGLYMEAHKSYKTAVADLEDFLSQLKVPFDTYQDRRRSNDSPTGRPAALPRLSSGVDMTGLVSRVSVFDGIEAWGGVGLRRLPAGRTATVIDSLADRGQGKSQREQQR